MRKRDNSNGHNRVFQIGTQESGDESDNAMQSRMNTDSFKLPTNYQSVNPSASQKCLDEPQIIFCSKETNSNLD